MVIDVGGQERQLFTCVVYFSVAVLEIELCALNVVVLYCNVCWFYVMSSVGNHGGHATGEVLLLSFNSFLILQFRCSCTSYCGS